MQLHLDTLNRTNGSRSNPVWNLRKPFPGSYMALTGMGFYYSSYPVKSHSIIFCENGNTGVTFTATIAAGSYTASSYASALQSAMNAAGGANTYTVNFSSTTGGLTIVPSTVTVSVRGVSLSTSASRYSGFYTNISFSMSITSDIIINLAGPLYIDVFINNTAGPGMDVNGNIFLARVPITGAFGDAVFYDDTSLPNYIPFTNQGNTFEIQLKDQFGESFINESDIYFIFSSK